MLCAAVHNFFFLFWMIRVALVSSYLYRIEVKNMNLFGNFKMENTLCYFKRNSLQTKIQAWLLYTEGKISLCKHKNTSVWIAIEMDWNNFIPGSEKVKDSGSSAEMLIESNNINRSLLVLGKAYHYLRKINDVIFSSRLSRLSLIHFFEGGHTSKFNKKAHNLQFSIFLNEFVFTKYPISLSCPLHKNKFLKSIELSPLNLLCITHASWYNT